MHHMHHATRTQSLISVVVPVYNEAGSLPALLSELRAVLSTLSYDAELVIVDDGSTDSTWDVITSDTASAIMVRGVKLARNFGKEQAIRIGLTTATGSAVVVMDGDLQHPPSLIPSLIKRWEMTGCEVVHAVKTDRANESMSHPTSVRLFHSIHRFLTGIDITSSSDFKLLSRYMVDLYLSLPEYGPFFRGLVPWLGHHQEHVPFSVVKRMHGRSKWNLIQRITLGMYAITSFSTAPLHLITLAGSILCVFALILGIHTLYTWYVGVSVEGFTTVILLLLVIGSSLMIGLGIVGQYLAHIYQAIKSRPGYIVEAWHQTPQV